MPVIEKPPSDVEEWQAITLKCVPFSSAQDKMKADQKQSGTAASTNHPNPLYITVALMEDENRDQRCFHCILTDCPGTDGKLGSVTPELFQMLFAPRCGAPRRRGSRSSLDQPRRLPMR